MGYPLTGFRLCVVRSVCVHTRRPSRSESGVQLWAAGGDLEAAASGSESLTAHILRSVLSTSLASTVPPEFCWLGQGLRESCRRPAPTALPPSPLSAPESATGSVTCAVSWLGVPCALQRLTANPFSGHLLCFMEGESRAAIHVSCVSYGLDRAAHSSPMPVVLTGWNSVWVT